MENFEPNQIIIAAISLAPDHQLTSWLEICLTNQTVLIHLEWKREITHSAYPGPSILSSADNDESKPGVTNIWTKRLDGYPVQGDQLPLGVAEHGLLDNIMHEMSLSLPFFPPPNPTLMLLGPIFAPPVGNLHTTPSPPKVITTIPHLTLERLERVNTLEALKETNKELEDLLSYLRVPRLEVLDMVVPLTLELREAVQEIMTILLPLGLGRIGVSTNVANPLKEEIPMVTLTPFNRKRKTSTLSPPPNPSGKEKEKVPQQTHPLHSMMKICNV